MAAITVDPKVVRVARADSEHYEHGVTGAALERGTVVVKDSTGRWVAGNGGGTVKPGILLHKSLSANIPVTAVKGEGAIVEVGDGLPAVGAKVYATAAGGYDDLTTSNQVLGTVISVGGQEFGGTPKKLLRLD